MAAGSELTSSFVRSTEGQHEISPRAGCPRGAQRCRYRRTQRPDGLCAALCGNSVANAPCAIVRLVDDLLTTRRTGLQSLQCPSDPVSDHQIVLLIGTCKLIYSQLLEGNAAANCSGSIPSGNRRLWSLWVLPFHLWMKNASEECQLPVSTYVVCLLLPYRERAGEEPGCR